MKITTTICALLILSNMNLWAQVYCDIASQQAINVSNPGGIFGNGVSFADFDRDGWDDLSFCMFGGPPLFFKNYNGQFQAYNFNLSFAEDQDAKCILWCDYDNDDDQDLLITYRNSPISLYRNEGDLQLVDVTEEVGLPIEYVEHFGASFGDYDGDGWLDLFVCKYHEEENQYQYANHLFKNDGLGAFVDVSSFAGVDDVNYASFQSAFFDYDKDGHLDLYVINDRLPAPNSLYHNNGDGTYTNVSEELNADVHMDAMCVTMGDYDNDTDLDIYMSNSENAGNVFLESQDGELFLDVASDLQLQVFELCWGSLFMDYNNDGWLDLYVASVENIGPDFSNHNDLFANEAGNFGNATSIAGLADDITVSYCVAMGDLDNDGFPDFAQHNFAPTNSRLYKNSGGANNWLKVELEGVLSNLAGIGTYIYAYVDGQVMTRYTQCGQNYLSQDSHRKMFGLGEATMIDSLVVDWPSGHSDVFYDVDVNQSLDIQEGSSVLPLISQSGPLCPETSVTLSAGIWSQYLWSTGDTTQNITITEPGFYWAQVANEFGFWSPSVQVTIDWAPIPSYNVLSEEISCFGDSTGSVSILFDIPGNNQITWDSGATGASLDSLSSGIYYFEILTAEGCIKTDSVMLAENPQIVNELSLTHVSCFGNADGTASVEVIGGLPPFTLTILDGDSSALSAGIYQLVISDSLGCSLSEDFEITEPDLLEITLQTSGANDGSSGTATIEAFGGTPPYSILWNPGPIDVWTLDALGEGSYTATITDSAGCSVDTTFLITSIVEIQLRNLKIWPNPFSEHLSFTSGLATPLKLDIFSSTGRLVLSFNDIGTQLHLPMLESEVYLFQFSVGDFKRNEIIIRTD